MAKPCDTTELKKRLTRAFVVRGLLSDRKDPAAGQFRFFRLRRRISSPMQAVQMRGLDIRRALVLTNHVFHNFRTDTLEEAETGYSWKHSLMASFSKHIALREKANRQLVDDCFTAGLLHDAGKLILASALEDKYHHVLQAVRESGQNLIAAEIDILGCSPRRSLLICWPLGALKT